jgi:hypothetical protein
MSIEQVNNPLMAPSYGEKSPESFLKFRADSAKEINDEICEKFMTDGVINYEAINRIFGNDPKTIETITFVLERFSHPKSPDKARRKDGSHIATHSLQLFRAATEFYKLSDQNVGRTVLVHDLVEDTQTTLEDISLTLGQKDAALANFMTEEELGEDAQGLTDKDASMLSIANFVHKLKKGGETIALAEIIDRMDDISDLNYLTKKLSNPETQEKAITALVDKFAKCSFTIEALIDENPSPEVARMKDAFSQLLDLQKRSIEDEFKVIIDQGKVEENKAKYYSFYNQEK